MTKKRGKQGKGKKRVGLSMLEYDRLKARLRGNDGEDPPRFIDHATPAPSEPWVDVQFFTAEDRDPDGNEIVYRFHNPKAFPLTADRGRDGKERTGAVEMVKCRDCGRVTPPQCVGSSGHCDDCRYGDMARRGLHLPSSASVVDMGRLKASRRRGDVNPTLRP